MKVRAAEEKKAKIESMYAQLQKSHQDLYHRYNEERENKLKAVDQLKDVCKEAAKERAEKLKEKNEKEKEKGRFSIYEDVNVSRQLKVSSSASEKDRSDRFRDQNRPPNFNINFNTKDQTNLSLPVKNLDPNSENGNNLTGFPAHSSPSSDREQVLSERNSLCRSLVSGSTFSACSGSGMCVRALSYRVHVSECLCIVFLLCRPSTKLCHGVLILLQFLSVEHCHF